jgi:hypothetical protein
MRHLLLAILLAVNASTNLASAQTANSSEFIEATSPLQNGGSVTSRTAPSEGLRTWFSPNSPPGATEPRETAANSDAGSGFGTLPAASTSPSSYPYPGLPAGGVPIGQVSALPFDPFAGTSAITQLPTLGILPQSSLRPDWQTGSLPPVGPPAATLTPALTPGTGGFASPTIQYPQVLPPVAGPVSSTGYRPLVRLRNMPPGTYLGQGVLGQPKAYVDGQPVRNLLRYVFIW